MNNSVEAAASPELSNRYSTERDYPEPPYRRKLLSSVFWLIRGGRLFANGPAAGIAMMVAIAIVMTICNSLGSGGGVSVVMSSFMMLLFHAGLIYVAERAHNTGEIFFSDLYEGVFGYLIPIAVLSVLFGVLVFAFSLLASSLTFLSLKLAFALSLPTNVAIWLGSSPLLAFVLLIVPLSAIMTFAPALIMFKQYSIAKALGASLKASWINKWPLLLFGLIVFSVELLPDLPYSLENWILMPLFSFAGYVAYARIFTREYP